MTQINPHAPDADFPVDSSSSQDDAGLDEMSQDDEETPAFYQDSMSDDIDSNLPPGPFEEISSARVDVESMDDPATRDTIRSPEMSDLNVPGEIDIEALGDDDLDEALPPDARLDPIEE